MEVTLTPNSWRSNACPLKSPSTVLEERAILDDVLKGLNHCLHAAVDVGKGETSWLIVPLEDYQPIVQEAISRHQEDPERLDVVLDELDAHEDAATDDCLREPRVPPRRVG